MYDIHQISAGPARITGLTIDPVASPAEIESPKAQALYLWWSSRDGRIPMRRDFDITEHRHLAANIFLLAVEDAGRYAFRVRGEHVVWLFGERTQGSTLSEQAATAPGHSLIEYYDRITEARAVFRCRGTLAFDETHRFSFESIDCPLVDEDGRVSHIVGVIELTGDR